MKQYIPKDALVVEIEKLIDEIYAGLPFDSLSREQQVALWYVKSIMSSINTLEVKEVGDNSLEKFKSLQHITGDLRQTLEDWEYAPNLYYFDGSWHVDWISCEEGDSIKSFTANTAEEAINEAYNWFHSTFCNS